MALNFTDAMLCDPPPVLAAERLQAQARLVQLRRDAMTVCESMPLPWMQGIVDRATTLEQFLDPSITPDERLLLTTLATIGLQCLQLDGIEIALGRIADRMRQPSAS
jgi:hypothetical protein